MRYYFIINFKKRQVITLQKYNICIILKKFNFVVFFSILKKNNKNKKQKYKKGKKCTY